MQDVGVEYNTAGDNALLSTECWKRPLAYNPHCVLVPSILNTQTS